jgi:type VI secretion system ImpJ/VasE family protein
MFLTPQLFEAHERFLESEIQLRASLGGFAKWGVSELKIDPGALAGSVFKVTECNGVFRNGIAFSMPEAEALPDQHNFELREDQERLGVFLAIQQRHERGQNIGVARKEETQPDAADCRYISLSDQTVYGDLDGQPEVIQVAEPLFKIVIEGESTRGLDLLQIARIVRSGLGGYVLDPEYIPPCLNVACVSGFWSDLSTKLLDKLAKVGTLLAKQRSQKDTLIADFSGSDLRRFWVLHLVNRAYPELNHIHGIRYCHPEDLYRFLLRLGGALFTFWAPDDAEKIYRQEQSKVEHDEKPPQYFGITNFPAYDHNNLGNCLPRVVNQLETMLTTMTYRKRRCRSVDLLPFKARTNHSFGTVTKHEVDNGLFYVGIKIDWSVSAADIDDSFKVVGQATEKNATTQAGLQLRLVERAPVDCTQQEGYSYYLIIQPTLESLTLPKSGSGRSQREDSFAVRRALVWEDIKQHGEIHLFIANQAHVLRVELLAVAPDPGASETLLL